MSGSSLCGLTLGATRRGYQTIPSGPASGQTRSRRSADALLAAAHPVGVWLYDGDQRWRTLKGDETTALDIGGAEVTRLAREHARRV